MQVFWDGYGLASPASGIFVYGRRLASELLARGVKPTLIGPPGASALFPDLAVHELPDVPALAKLGRLKPIWPERVGQAVARLAKGPYVVHGLSNFNVPALHRSRGQRRVLTIHDITPLLAPKLVSTALAVQMRWLLPRAIDAADRIVCDSEWTRRTVAERRPAAASKCLVIPLGVPRSEGPRRPPGRSAKINALYVARSEPYKRLDLFFKTLAAAPPKLIGTLVTDERGIDLAKSVAAELLSQRRLILKTGLSPRELTDLYGAVDVYVHPSRYEGFCLPVAEALAAGTPVVYQPGTGIDQVMEVVGGQPVGFPVLAVDDPGAWLASIDQAVQSGRSPDFAARADAHLAHLPSWKDAAQALESLYNDLIQG